LEKLFGNLAVLVLAIADAFRMAKGFFPVKELPWPPPDPTRLLVPLVFVVLEMPFAAGPVAGAMPLPPSACFWSATELKLRTSARNYSIL
jgi:hypothetical protein